jgi:hypothetical protein
MGDLISTRSSWQFKDFVIEFGGQFPNLKSPNLIEEFQVTPKILGLDARGLPHYGEVLGGQGHVALKVVDPDLLVL